MSELETLLIRLGVTANYKGYRQAILAISLAAEHPDILLLVTKRLYPAVAKEQRTTWRAVERNIRLAADRAWQCNPALLSSLAGYQLAEKPTASQFISILAAGDTPSVWR